MLARLIALLATGEAAVVKRRVKTTVAAYLAIAVTALLALIFLLLAAYLAAASRWGPTVAALWFGIGFFVLCVVAYAAYRIIAGAQRRAQQHRRAADTSMLAGASAMAMLPALLGKRSGTIGLLLTLAGLAGYAAFRQYRGGRSNRPRD